MKEKVLWDWTKLNQKKEEDNTNKIKKNTEVRIRKDETQHRNEGSLEEFIESEKKRRRARYKKHWKKFRCKSP